MYKINGKNYKTPIPEYHLKNGGGGAPQLPPSPHAHAYGATVFQTWEVTWFQKTNLGMSHEDIPKLTLAKYKIWYINGVILFYLLKI